MSGIATTHLTPPEREYARSLGLNITKLETGSLCAACAVMTGECPRCGTFIWVTAEGKRLGVTRGSTPSEAVMAVENRVAARVAHERAESS